MSFKPRQPKEKDPLWSVCVNTWFFYFKDKFKEDPTFIGASAANYKKLVTVIRKKTTDKGIIWNERAAIDALMCFFDAAYFHKDPKFQAYMRNNFTTSILLYHIDKISVLNGKQFTSGKPTLDQFLATVREAKDGTIGEAAQGNDGKAKV